MRIRRPTILIDSKEKKPWDFPGYRIETTSLEKFGCDYTLRGYSKYIGVERKSIADFIRSTRSKKFRELQAKRIGLLAYGCIIVDGDPRHADIMSRNTMSSDELITAAAQIMVDYRIPILFTGDRQLAAIACIEYLLRAKKALESR